MSIVLDQPVYSSQEIEEPGSVCLLRMYLYGARQAVMLWGSLIDTDLSTFGYYFSHYDPQMFLMKTGQYFLDTLFVVDDIAIASDNHGLLDPFL